MKFLTILCFALLSAGSAFAGKPRIKDVKTLDPKAMDLESIEQRHGAISQSETEVFDIKCFDISVDSAKQSGLSLQFQWVGTELKEPKKAHVWFGGRKWTVEADAKGDVTKRTDMVLFCKNVEEGVRRTDGMAYTFEGWVVYLLDSKGAIVDHKASSGAVEKLLKDAKKS